MRWQKHESYKYILPLKNWVNWINTMQEKMSQPQKCIFSKKSAQKLKNMLFSPSLPKCQVTSSKCEDLILLDCYLQMLNDMLKTYETV